MCPSNIWQKCAPQTFWLKCAPSNNLTLMHRWKTKKNKEKWWFTHFRRKLSFVVITSFLGGTFWSNVVSGGTKTFYRTGRGRAAERVPTGKSKVSRVTSGLGEYMIPLNQVCLRSKKCVIWVWKKTTDFWAKNAFFCEESRGIFSTKCANQIHYIVIKQNSQIRQYMVSFWVTTFNTVEDINGYFLHCSRN